MASTLGLSRLPTSPVVATGLIGGFALADATGNRPLGGVLLGAAGVLAGATWLKRDGAVTTAALSALYVGGFVLSHPLAKQIGAWPSVFAVSTVAAAAAYGLSDRRSSPTVSGVRRPTRR